MSIWGCICLFVGPVGVGVPARALEPCFVGMYVRERASVGVHVMGVRGSVWAGGGGGLGSGGAVGFFLRLTHSSFTALK